MGLETATFVSGMTAAWPLAGDKKNQGDDHLRLLKSVLQNTFPSANRAFYFPKTEAVSGTITLDATDQNNDLMVDTSGGNVVVNLPSTLGSGDAGWECVVVKTTSDANAAIVTPASGTITSKVGATNTIRVGQRCDPVKFKWNGTGWICYKSGPMIGSTENFDGTSLPPGYLDARGGSYNSTDFAELFAVLASSTLRDKGGRTEVGQEAVASRITTGNSGFDGATLGAAGGNETITLIQAKLPNVTLNISGTANVLSSATDVVRGQLVSPVMSTNVPSGTYTLITAGTGSSAQLASSGSISGATASINGNVAQQAQMIVQPTIVVRKIVRAC